MPLFYQHNINEATKLGIWKIDEDEDYFLQKVPLQRQISHPHKRLQHLAGRYLLQFLFPDFPYSLIRIADTRRPFLENETYQFSISHCGDFAAVIVSSENRVGIDIEIVKPVILRIKDKFLTRNEMDILQKSSSKDPANNHFVDAGSNNELLTLCWSVKEAMFKWFGEGGVDFREHMVINAIVKKADNGWLDCTFRKKSSANLLVHFRRFDDLVLAWLNTVK